MQDRDRNQWISRMDTVSIHREQLASLTTTVPFLVLDWTQFHGPKATFSIEHAVSPRRERGPNPSPRDHEFYDIERPIECKDCLILLFPHNPLSLSGYLTIFQHPDSVDETGTFYMEAYLHEGLLYRPGKHEMNIVVIFQATQCS